MEDINAILKKAQSGDNEAIDLILKEYSKLLSFNAQKYYLVGAEKEDLVQEGILGLLKAIKFYDETKSSFSSFAFLLNSTRTLVSSDMRPVLVSMNCAKILVSI